MTNDIKSAIEMFKPGLYRHYKGGLYTALCLVTHHDSRQPMVLYTSLTYGGTNVRPLVGWVGDPDGWFDWKTDPVTGVAVSRFFYIGDLPSNIPAEERFKHP